jgi:hypothetical protein
MDQCASIPQGTRKEYPYHGPMRLLRGPSMVGVLLAGTLWWGRAAWLFHKNYVGNRRLFTYAN